MAQLGILRVAADGRVIAADDGATKILGRCVGLDCRAAVGARARDGGVVCDRTCHAGLDARPGRCRHEDGAVVGRRVSTLTCTRVGDETVVVLAPGPHAPAAYPDRLTAREREVLGLVEVGLTNRQIAAALGVSMATVRTHVEHVLAKLGASTRAQAVSVARALGEIAG